MLIERLRAQDASVLEILMERYSPRIYRVAFGITRSHGDAEEVVQDVFVTLFRKSTRSKAARRSAPGSIAWPPMPR